MKLSYLVLALFCMTSAAALQQVIVEQGETILVRVDTHARSSASEIAADFSIDELGYSHYVSKRYSGTSILEDELTLNARPGTYIMRVQLYVNRAFVRQESIAITILSEEDAQREEQEMEERVEPVKPMRLTLQPVPDVTPGTTLVLPVKITGNGTYQLSVNKLDFATYEVPAPVTVRNEATTSILLHVHENAPAGTYNVTVRAGREETSVRIRVIEYTQKESSYTALIFIGLFIILLGILFIVLMNRRDRRKQRPTTRDEQPPQDGELITYY